MAEESRYAESVDGELWELASMEYPGKNEDEMDLEFDDEEDYVPDEPRLREWLKWVVMTMWLLALGIAVPAMNEANYSDKLPPGCYLSAEAKNIAQSRFGNVIRDPTINLLLSTMIINYVLAGVFMIVCSVLLCTLRWTQDGKLNRFFKMTIGLCAMYLAARSPVDILQFIDVVHASQGTNVTNLRPDQLEHEVLLFWAALIPVVGNPVIYLFCVTEYRQNILNVWKSCTQGEGKLFKSLFNNLHIYYYQPRRMCILKMSSWTFPMISMTRMTSTRSRRFSKLLKAMCCKISIYLKICVVYDVCKVKSK